MASLTPGSVLAGYTIVRALGTGGMGTVYLAKHPRLPKHVALKVLAPALGIDPSFRVRFEREAHLAAQLDHPNVVSVHDCGSADGLMWLAMQFVEGSNAAMLMSERANGLDPAQALDILAQAARGLDAAHQRGILHRDIKPANLMVTPGWDGSADSERVLVSDFGIARTLDSATVLTQTGSFLGTLAYAAPELIEGVEVDHRADIYSLGCTLHAMLTGSVAFPRSNPMAIMHAHMAATPPRPSETHPHLPPAIDTVIATAMAKDPADRYPTCRALAEAAASALAAPHLAVTVTSPVQAPAPPTPTRPSPAPGRSRRGLVVGAVVSAVLALLVVAGVIALRPDDSGDPGAAATPSATSPTGPGAGTRPSTPASSLTGRWSGTVSGDQSGFDVVADISDGPPLRALVNYPQLNCRGVWTETGYADGTVRKLTESIDQGTCVQSSITLTPKDDGTLEFTSTYYAASKNRNLTIHATLRR
ncbi:serine/threonine-protein kinase [Nocardia sp. NPDC057668]|uniref:serine/threonine-protein kinase n=1 Tax=Nocardia sp. NPDC057668 TaxID=3346202 RepID=UPI00366E7F7F